MMGDRYEKRQSARQSHQMATGLEDFDDSQEINPDETRSLVAELDYTKKDATRHIVTNTGTSGDKLRQRLLRNLEGVRKNKPILKSEASVGKSSIRSRMSNMSARQSQAQSPRNIINASLIDAAGRLSKIEEQQDGEIGKCQACLKEILEEEDMAMCDEISRNLVNEIEMKVAYNDFRRKRDLEPIDFSNEDVAANHRVNLCIDCLLTCF